MSAELGPHKCEHCGAYVPIAKICPYCTKEHSEEWLKACYESEAWTIPVAVLWGGVAWGYFSYFKEKIKNLPIQEQFDTGVYFIFETVIASMIITYIVIVVVGLLYASFRK